MHKKYLTPILLSLILGSAFTGLSIIKAQATTDTVTTTTVDETTQTTTKTRLERIQELRQMNAQKRCERVEQNVEARIDRYTLNHQNVGGRLNGLLQKIENVTARLDSNGADTTDLETMTTELKLLIDDTQDLKDELVTNMMRVKTIACKTESNPRQELKDLLADSKELLSQIRENVKDIKSLVKDDIVAEIRKLAAK
jgi:peptidoglycan hydrolase CwlO-like protein